MLTKEKLQNHKCDDPICDTNLWRVKHELDLARLKMRSLEVELRSKGITPPPSLILRTSILYQDHDKIGEDDDLNDDIDCVPDKDRK